LAFGTDHHGDVGPLSISANTPNGNLIDRFL
jgi:hypothetical protein